MSPKRGSGSSQEAAVFALRGCHDSGRRGCRRDELAVSVSQIAFQKGGGCAAVEDPSPPDEHAYLRGLNEADFEFQRRRKLPGFKPGPQGESEGAVQHRGQKSPLNGSHAVQEVFGCPEFDGDHPGFGIHLDDPASKEACRGGRRRPTFHLVPESSCTAHRGARRILHVPCHVLGPGTTPRGWRGACLNASVIEEIAV